MTFNKRQILEFADSRSTALRSRRSPARQFSYARSRRSGGAQAPGGRRKSRPEAARAFGGVAAGSRRCWTAGSRWRGGGSRFAPNAGEANAFARRGSGGGREADEVRSLVRAWLGIERTAPQEGFDLTGEFVQSVRVPATCWTVSRLSLWKIVYVNDGRVRSHSYAGCRRGLAPVDAPRGETPPLVRWLLDQRRLRPSSLSRACPPALSRVESLALPSRLCPSLLARICSRVNWHWSAFRSIGQPLRSLQQQVRTRSEWRLELPRLGTCYVEDRKHIKIDRWRILPRGPLLLPTARHAAADARREKGVRGPRSPAREGPPDT